jgi:hypothetical protein
MHLASRNEADFRAKRIAVSGVINLAEFEEQIRVETQFHSLLISCALDYRMQPLFNADVS